MSRHQSLALVLAALSMLLVLPVEAGEVLIFTNGTSMIVDSHEVVDGRIWVELDGGEMAFPASMVDRIEQSNKSSFSASSGNRMVGGRGAATGGGDERVGQNAQFNKANTGLDPNKASGVEVDEATGLASYRPLAGSDQRGKRELRVTGSERVLRRPTAADRSSASDLKGAARVGNRYVIGNTGPRRRPGEKPRPPIFGMQAKPDGATTADSPPADGGDSSGSSDGGDSQN